MEKFDDYRKLGFPLLLKNEHKKCKTKITRSSKIKKQEVQLLKIDRFIIHKKGLRNSDNIHKKLRYFHVTKRSSD